MTSRSKSKAELLLSGQCGNNTLSSAFIWGDFGGTDLWSKRNVEFLEYLEGIKRECER